jgi:hypothetical protein
MKCILRSTNEKDSSCIYVNKDVMTKEVNYLQELEEE